MSKLEVAKAYLEKVKETQSTGTSFLLENKQKLTAESTKIEGNAKLSAEGKADAIQTLREKMGVEFLQTSYIRQQDVKRNAIKAKAAAEEILYAPAPKPDAKKLQRFESALKELRTHLMLSTRADSGYEALTSFIKRNIDGPYLAGVVRDQFAEIAAAITNAPEADGSLKLKLAATFERLKGDYESAEVKEARAIYEEAEAVEERPQLYSTGKIIQDAAEELFGKTHAQYINSPADFFSIEGNESLKPEDVAEEPEVEEELDIYAEREAAREEWLKLKALGDYARSLGEAAYLKEKAADLQKRADALGTSAE
ncbi:hypothetical protein [Paenibacillus mesotrionivorans]|uniref:Uncharacterized protein n=1 Tax=Paenibacillus mesotrionivorans TaxID=3160968 RepID=A0ACC7NY37_9BACL